MPYGYVAAAAVSAYGSWRASKQASEGAKQAAQIQADAANKAVDWQQQAYNDIKPYLMSSLTQYQDLMKNPQSVKQTPGYLFRLNQGLEAIGIPAGSKFQNLSGNQVRGAIQYGQDYATSEYQNALARIAGLGSLAQGNYQPGANAATTAGKFLMGGANASAAGITGAANARAAGTLGVTNALTQGYQNYQLYRMYQNYNQPTGTGSTVSSPTNYYGSGYVAPGGSFDTSMYSNYGNGGYSSGQAVDYGSSNY